MICYFYPPLVDVGCQRSVAFSKYFYKYGWTPYVLSVRNPDKTFCTVGNDQEPFNIHTEYCYSIINIYFFIARFNAVCSRFLNFLNIKITRNYFCDIFCIPDMFWGWIPLATIRSLKLIKKYGIDLIYTSCSPFSSAIIGILLKQLTGKPLILDFRDPLAFNAAYYDTCPKFRRLIDQRFERWMIKNADMFFVTSEELLRNYVSMYPDQHHKIFNVHNGFDPTFLPQKRLGKYAKFTIVYAGDFYHNVHSLKIFTHAFFAGLRLLKTSGRTSCSNFQFLYYGESVGSVQQIASEYSVEDLVSARAPVSHSKILTVILKSHLQLLRVIPPMIRTSLFEAIALNVPLLATILPGEAQEIIRTYSPSSYVLSDGSSDTVADAIFDAINKYENGHIKDNHVGRFLEAFSRESLALKFMNIVDENISL